MCHYKIQFSAAYNCARILTISTEIFHDFACLRLIFWQLPIKSLSELKEKPKKCGAFNVNNFCSLFCLSSLFVLCMWEVRTSRSSCASVQYMLRSEDQSAFFQFWALEKKIITTTPMISKTVPWSLYLPIILENFNFTVWRQPYRPWFRNILKYVNEKCFSTWFFCLVMNTTSLSLSPHILVSTSRWGTNLQNCQSHVEFIKGNQKERDIGLRIIR